MRSKVRPVPHSELCASLPLRSTDVRSEVKSGCSDCLAHFHERRSVIGPPDRLNVPGGTFKYVQWGGTAVRESALTDSTYDGKSIIAGNSFLLLIHSRFVLEKKPNGCCHFALSNCPMGVGLVRYTVYFLVSES